MKYKKLVKNAIRCKNCGDIIESKYTHDFKFCSCGKVAVDGGLDYLRRCGNSDDYEDLSTYEYIEIISKYKRGDTVSFKYRGEYKIGAIDVVDTFEDSSMPTYDIFSETDGTLYKRVYEKDILGIEYKKESSILTIEQIKERIKPIMDKHKIKDVYIFGSYARKEATEFSDVDFYCDKGDVKSLNDEVMFQEELENALHKKVDVVIIGSHMHDFFKEQIERDMLKLW